MVVDSPVAVASSVRSSVVWEGARSVVWCRWPLGGTVLGLEKGPSEGSQSQRRPLLIPIPCLLTVGSMLV